MKLLWEKAAYAVSLLGICVDVTSSWAALEYDAGGGGESISKKEIKDKNPLAFFGKRLYDELVGKRFPNKA